MASPRTPSSPASAARGSFAEMLNRAAYGKERVVVTRRGKALAAIVPMEDMMTLDALAEMRDAQPISKRRAAWLRSGRKSSAIEKVEKKSIAPNDRPHNWPIVSHSNERRRRSFSRRQMLSANGFVRSLVPTTTSDFNTIGGGSYSNSVI